LIEHPVFTAQAVQLLAFLGTQPFPLALVDLLLLDPPPQDSLASPNFWATIGINFSDERYSSTASRLNSGG
jgi:hypothetical protein